ncbi:MAG: glycosyltransferase family 2 protein [Betaproteobacteria bacterium]
MESKVVISVITIVKNDVYGIEKTIQSVIDQDYQNIDYIVIDGNSTDGTVKLIEKYLRHINYYVSEQDDGIYSAFNKGIMASKGQLINILNSGDIFPSNRTVSNFVKFYLDNCSRVVYGKAMLLDSPVKFSKSEVGYRTLGGARLGTYAYNICHQAMLYEKSIHSEIGLYDTNYKIAAEHKFTLESIYLLGIAPLFYPETVVHYRGGGVSADPKHMYEYKKVDDLIVGRTIRHELLFFLRRVSNFHPFLKKIVRTVRNLLGTL